MASSVLSIGNDKHTIEAAAKAIIDVLKHANDVSSVAALHTLAELARNHQTINISNCTFDAGSKGVSRK